MKRKLDFNHKLFIVRCHARFMTPTAIVKAVKEEFGIELVRQNTAMYHPDRHKRISKELLEHFDEHRKIFMEEINAVPIAHQSVRINLLWDMAQRAQARGNDALLAQIIEQAAKEMGGAYTNRSAIVTMDLSQFSNEELERLAAGDSPEQVMTARRQRG